MKAIILAGGKGTRLSSITKTLPKSMVPLFDKPLLEYQIELLKKNDIKEITVVIHYGGDVIKQYFGDGTSKGVNINYFKEDAPFGTAGSIREIATDLQEDFLLLYGDLLINMDLRRLIKYHKRRKAQGTLVIHPNNHPFDSDIIEVNSKDKIIAFHSKPHQEGLLYSNLVNAAIYILSPAIAKYIPKGKPSDFGKDIFPKLIKSGEVLFGYITHEYIKDIGTPERFYEAIDDIKASAFQYGSIHFKRPAIFFDRDGVIIKEKDNISKVTDVELYPQTSNALKKVNRTQYLSVIITNQPQVAKGLCDMETIQIINRRVETLLGNQGAKVDGIYFCPHHPEKGFLRENKIYKRDCICRKPKIGMIKKAVKRFNIDLSQSCLVGDSTTDALTAFNAGIQFVGVKTGYGCKDGKYNIKNFLVLQNIDEAVDYITKRN